jgi:hypothetical protein
VAFGMISHPFFKTKRMIVTEGEGPKDILHLMQGEEKEIQNKIMVTMLRYRNERFGESEKHILIFEPKTNLLWQTII